MGNKISSSGEYDHRPSSPESISSQDRKRHMRLWSTRNSRHKVFKMATTPEPDAKSSVMETSASITCTPGTRLCATNESADHDVCLARTGAAALHSPSEYVRLVPDTPQSNTSTTPVSALDGFSGRVPLPRSRRESGHTSVLSSHWTTDGLFSQVEPVTSSVITAATEYTIMSRRSPLAKFTQHDQASLSSPGLTESPSEQVLPSSSSSPRDRINLTSPETIDTSSPPSANDVISQLSAAPKDAYAIIHHFSTRAKLHQDIQLYGDIFLAAQAWAGQTGCAASQAWVARCYIEGWGTPPQPSVGLAQLRSLARQQHWEAYYPLALCYLNGVRSMPANTEDENDLLQEPVTMVQQVDKETALEWFMAAAVIDPAMVGVHALDVISRSQYHVGEILFARQDQDNANEAIQWFAKSAENGNRFAQFILGHCFERGIQVDRDHEKAKSYYLQSAQQGYRDAQAALGIRLVDEGLVEPGVHWLQEAKSKEDTRAMLKLGIMYEKGIGLEQDDRKAALLYQAAAQRGNSKGQYILGRHYRMGTLGLEQNNKAAQALFRRSARAGFAPAQRMYGLMFKEGLISLSTSEDSRQQEEAAALYWFKRAAEQWDACALGLVGGCYETGKGGITIDYDAALICYTSAASIVGPFQSGAHYAMAMLLHRMGRYAEAYHHFKHSTQISSCSESYRSHIRTAQLMIARYQLNHWYPDAYDPQNGFHALLALVTSDETDTEAQYWLAACYEKGIPGHVSADSCKAFEHYFAAAQLGDSAAEYQVATMLTKGEGVVQDQVQARTWYEKAAAKDHPAALYCLGLCYADGTGGLTKDMAQAAEYFEKAAQLEEPAAMKAFADWCRLTARSSRLTNAEQAQFNQTAVSWYRQAVSHLHVGAMRELALVYDRGLPGVPQDQASAYRYLKEASDKDDPTATVLLGRYYQDGIVVEANASEALGLYSYAIKLGAPIASYAAAELCRQQNRMEDAYAYYQIASHEDRLADTRVGTNAKLMAARLALQRPRTDEHREAFKVIYRLATEEEYSPAYYWLADCYDQGCGTRANGPLAVEWFEKAAELAKDPLAMMKLGERFEHGQDVPQDDLMALDYFKQSARCGHPEGQYRVGTAYWRGLYGADINLGEAVVWFTQAAAQKHDESRWALGMMALENGDDDVAIEWWRKAIDLGHGRSMHDLARLLLKNQEADQDQDMVKMLEQLARDAIRSGDADVLVLLGRYHQSESERLSAGDINHEKSHGDEEEDSQDDSGSENDASDEERHRKQAESRELATRCFAQAAVMGNVEAMHLAAESWHAQEQYAAALEYYERAASHGHIPSRIMRARYQLFGQGGLSINAKDAYEELLVCAQHADGEDAYPLLGHCYEHGLGTGSNDRQALEWYVRSADAGNADAMYHVGRMHATGRSPTLADQHEPDDYEAYKWYSHAVRTGNHASAHYHLGIYLLHGIQDRQRTWLEPNPEKAMRHFTSAAEQGHPTAMFEIGEHLISQRTFVSSVEGLSWWLRAAESGSCDAERELGKLYHTGLEVGNDVTPVISQDFQKSYDYFCRAAKNRDETSALFLGMYHEHGIHVPPNMELAIEWYRMAVSLCAENDLPQDSQRWLAELALARALHHDLTRRSEAFGYFEPAYHHAPNGEQKMTAAAMLARYRLHGWGQVEVEAEAAVSTLVQLAQKGYYKVYLEVAQCYDMGVGLESNRVEAFGWYNTIVDHVNRNQDQEAMDEEDEEDYVEALTRLAEFYRHGWANLDPDVEYAQRLQDLAAHVKHNRLDEDS